MTRGRTVHGYVQFRDGSRIPYPVPPNTFDPRYIACTQHRVACDCREAELAEDRADLNAELKSLREVFRRVLGDHPNGCMCTGCQVFRESRLHFLIDDTLPGPMEKTNV
ncbi:hypothetical protein [Micromonospora sp. NBC_00421]|uniref:hypothetical protein n=1 Tax=Micromonospora sp. NBC_00421 TaxID=2975976 RepID=UPI002E1C9F8E